MFSGFFVVAPSSSFAFEMFLNEISVCGANTLLHHRLQTSFSISNLKFKSKTKNVAKRSHQCCTVHAPLLFGKWRSFPAFRQFRIASASSGSF
jgi:hypothetical protein